VKARMRNAEDTEEDAEDAEEEKNGFLGRRSE
jgi:hypothetical protein